MKELLKKVVLSNKLFFERNFSKEREEILLYESFYAEKQLIYGISKIALSVAHIKKLKPVCLTPFTFNRDQLSFIRSINPNTIDTRKGIAISFLLNLLTCLKVWRIQNKKDILNFSIRNVNIGPYIYDTLLRKLALPEIKRLNFKMRLLFLIEVLHFLFFLRVFKRYKIRFVVLGDTVYRYGLLFEICRAHKIPNLSAIDLNAFSFAKYIHPDDFNHHPRKIPREILDSILGNQLVEERIDLYMNRRMKGEIDQHDVITAYRNKNYTSGEDFYKKYNLKQNLPVITVMAHIFSDAPHGYPSVLYNDYYEWLENTVKCLQNNKHINFLVKEHPSASIYGEQGILADLLKTRGIENAMVDKKESTKSIIENSSVIVTCGGTIGLEFSIQGKPVVLASRPPYSGLGFTIDCQSRTEYEYLLEHTIHKCRPLSDHARKKALCAAYISFELFTGYEPGLEIGSERILLGKKYDDKGFFEKILEFNKIPLANQNMYNYIKAFLNSDHLASIDPQKYKSLFERFTYSK
jgi:hypothetical protein